MKTPALLSTLLLASAALSAGVDALSVVDGDRRVVGTLTLGGIRARTRTTDREH